MLKKRNEKISICNQVSEISQNKNLRKSEQISDANS